ncbi:protein kinase [Frankia sp. AiPs1]|uniref:serine/threonine protein kinase n=1 Tax=Frankia sp. AiPs1 TaxID=573493 RepID=UPI0020448973|nr:serine/threonine protein kinase [Frankia sp. AiPs1]MCM3920373.1 protein kinase [Frankia sp. AiPs1]
MTRSIAAAGVPVEAAAVDQPGSPLRAADPTVIGDFRVLRLLGEGGMGTVYLGESSTGRPVAIKVIRPEYANVTEFRERFRRETTHARQVAGFCTAEVLDACPDAEFPYLVTEFVPGPTLGAAVTAGGPLSPADLERLGIGMASALTAIHAAGIAHFDLTPSNVLLHPAGPRVIDFGIANALGAALPVDDDATWIGTPGYMAPEQAHSDRVGAAADVFAWAGVLVFAATGRPPFGDGAPDVVVHRTLHEEPDLSGLSGLPAGMIGLVRRALRKDPDARPTAGEVLLGLLGGTEADAAPAVARALDGWRAPTLRLVGGEDPAAQVLHGSTAVIDPPTLPQVQEAAQVQAAPRVQAAPLVREAARVQEIPQARAESTAGQRGGRRRRAAVLAVAAVLLALIATAVPVAMGADREQMSPPTSVGAEAGWLPVVSPPPPNQPGGGGTAAATDARPEAARTVLTTPDDRPPGGTAAKAAGPAGRTFPAPKTTPTSRPPATTPLSAAGVPVLREAVPSTSGAVPQPPETQPGDVRSTASAITPDPASSGAATAGLDRSRTFSRPGRAGTPLSRDGDWFRHRRHR